MTQTETKLWVPPAYDTPEKRIAHVAHRWNTQYNYTAEYLSRGFTREEIAAGEKLGRERQAQFFRWRERYGSPEYGGWSTDPADGVRKPVEEFAKASA